MSWHESEAYGELYDVLRFLGYRVGLQNTADSGFSKTHGVIQNFLAPKINDGMVHLVLDKSESQKERFLELFENRGWQPQLRKRSPHGPRAGPSAQVDSLDNPISTIWEIRINGALDIDIFEAELLAELGTGGNEWIYVWSGYLACYPEGYSNMILMEWFDEYSDSKREDDIAGEIYYGENAYQRLKELRTREGLNWSFYPSINRKVIP
jgi:hypothetical protein